MSAVCAGMEAVIHVAAKADHGLYRQDTAPGMTKFAAGLFALQRGVNNC